MSEFKKISFPSLLKYHNLSADDKKGNEKGKKGNKKGNKKGDKKYVTMFSQKEEEETSIYEYDYDCLKSRELLGHTCIEHKKR